MNWVQLIGRRTKNHTENGHRKNGWIITGCGLSLNPYDVVYKLTQKPGSFPPDSCVRCRKEYMKLHEWLGV